MARQAPQVERREPGWIGRDARTTVMVEGFARRSDGAVFNVVVHDISREGCRIECSGHTVEIGEWVQVEGPGLPPQLGQVRWALLGSAGLRFSN
jgi:hypothetical protein